MNTENALRYGYWPAVEMSKSSESAIIRDPSDFIGGETLELSCTQTGLPQYEQKMLVESWCKILPDIPVTHLYFRSRVNQKLFDAASSNQQIESLFVKWGKFQNLNNLRGHPSLKKFYLGSYPGIESVEVLTTLPNLTHLVLGDVFGDFDFRILQHMTKLIELGICARPGKKLGVTNLEVLSNLRMLKMLWAVGWRINPEDLRILSKLPELMSLRTEWSESSDRIFVVKGFLENLKYYESVFHG